MMFSILSLYMWLFNMGKLWPSLARGLFLSARGWAEASRDPSSLEGSCSSHCSTPPPSGRLSFWTQTQHKTIIQQRETGNAVQSQGGNTTSISISFAQTDGTHSQGNKFTPQFSFYLFFCALCKRNKDLFVNSDVLLFICCAADPKRFRLCREQRPACLLTWLLRNGHL